MLHIRKLSGEVLGTVPLQEELSDVRALKQRLQQQLTVGST